MTKDKPQIDPETLRRIIEATVSAAGEPDPATLPHRIREQLAGRVTGDIDLEQYIRKVLREMRKD